MNSDKNILDNPDYREAQQNKLKSRVPSDLMIVVGVLLCFLSVYCFYHFFSAIRDSLLRYTESLGGEATGPWFLRILLFQGLSLLLGIVVLIGGIGLIRHKIFGWVFSLGAAVFSLLLPFQFRLVTLLIPNLQSSVSTVFSFLYLSLFVLTFWFLLSNTIRKFFDPRMKSYLIAGIIVIVLSTAFLVPPILFSS